MRKITFIIVISTFLLLGCSKHQPASDKLLDEVERIIEVNPDSASNILSNISSPEKLDDKAFARWCMLSGKITDKIFNTILPTFQLERAYTWYSSYGSPNEEAQILIYLGRSNATDGDYEKAMSIYTSALDIAKKNNLNNLIGYTYCYIGDLYAEKAMRTEAIKKYETAAGYFKKENNTDSYACALRDMAREFAIIDSIPCALEILYKADSIAVNSSNKNVTASIFNAFGNIYAMQEKYDKAQEYLLKALALGRNKRPNYVALTDLYIATDSINLAKELLKKIPQDDSTYTYSIKHLYYQIYKSEKKYKEALANLEEYAYIADSILYAASQSKILDIEAKYNHLKMEQEVNKLKIKQQSYIIVLIICISALLLITVLYLLYRKKVKGKIQKQEVELSKMKIELLNLSLELEKKRNLLNTFKEKDENYNKMQEEIELLTINYQKLQNKILSDSSLYKELSHLANQNIPGHNKSSITKDQWRLITNEITTVYPNIYTYIYSLCPELPEQDFQYCCFYMYGFDTNAEAKLLNITPSSARTKHFRLRQKLNISLPANSTLHEYLIENMC